MGSRSIRLRDKKRKTPVSDITPFTIEAQRWCLKNGIRVYIQPKGLLYIIVIEKALTQDYKGNWNYLGQVQREVGKKEYDITVVSIEVCRVYERIYTKKIQ